jgi:RNA polymerase primary sigma factor
MTYENNCNFENITSKLTEQEKNVIHNGKAFFDYIEKCREEYSKKSHLDCAELIVKYHKNNGEDRELEKKILNDLTNQFSCAVCDIAKKYVNSSFDDWEDLIQNGYLGMLKSFHEYDFRKNINVKTFVYKRIEWAILKHLDETKRLVKTPSNFFNTYNRIENVKENLEKKVGLEVSYDEALNLVNPENNLEIYLNFVHFLETTNTSTFNDDKILTYNCIEKEIRDENLKEEVNNILEVLEEERERVIITLHFGLNEDKAPMALEEIGDKYGLTRERCRQIRDKALRRLRYRSRADNLKDYL